MKEFPCDACGACCKHIGITLRAQAKLEGSFAKAIAEFPYKLVGDMCEKFDVATNKCTVYETRPLLCNVNALRDAIVPNMPVNLWHILNKNGCKTLKRKEKMLDDINKTTTKKAPWYAIIDTLGVIIKSSDLDYLERLRTAMVAHPSEITEEDEIELGDDLNLEFNGKLRIVDIANVPSVAGRYYNLVQKDTLATITAFCEYKEIDGKSVLGFRVQNKNEMLFLKNTECDYGKVPLKHLFDWTILADSLIVS